MAFILLIVLAVAAGNLIQALGVLRGPDSGGGNTLPGAPTPPSSPFTLSRGAVQVTILALMGVGAIMVLWLIIQAFRRGRKTRLLPPALSSNVFVLALMALLLGFVALALTRGRNTLTPFLGGRPDVPGSSPPTPTVQPPNVVAPNVPLGLLLLVGAMGILLAVALVQGARYKPRPPSSGPRRDVAQEVARAADVLTEGGDFREAILRCYVNTCRLLALKGAPSDVALTAREFEEGARPLLGLSERSLGRLTNLFEVARYSPHPVGPPDRDDAVACLRAIQGELEG